MPNLEAMTQFPAKSCNSRGSRQRNFGTTLIEILVVIVVFLVGILAVVQIFPKGFQLLLLNRNKTVAQSLARDYVELLKSAPDQLPEQIVSAYYSNGNLIINSAKDSNDLSTVGASLNSNGFMFDAGGNPLGLWQQFTASNVFRRVIGEGRRVPSPRTVGANGLYGGLLILQFGPINYQAAGVSTPANISVYGNDLEQIIGLPSTIQVQRTDYQYFVSNPTTSSVAVSLPTGSSSRSYRFSFSAYVSNGSGGLIKRDYTELTPVVVAGQNTDASGQYPLTNPIALTGSGGLVTDPIQSVDLNTLRVQRYFIPLDKATGSFSATDPYEYKLLNENLGVLLFNPIGNAVTISREGHDREPLTARVNYDVYDWRILHDDFRIDAGILPGEPSSVSPQSLIAQHKLPIGSLKVANNAGVDGLPNTPIPTLETARGDGTTDTSAANAQGSDNFVLLDLSTGGVFIEQDPSTGQKLIGVDKSTGIVTLYDADNDSTNGITGELLLPDGSTSVVQMDNRPVRALFMTNQEYSVQVLKAASRYTLSTTATNLAAGQFYIGGTVSGIGLPNRIYFSSSDNGRKVSIGELSYLSSADSFVHELFSQDFLIRPGNDPTLSLPFIDLTSIDPNATSVSFQNGIGARDVKGMSVAVRVLWNPTSFHLTGNSSLNMSSLNTWGQSWRKSTNETFLMKGGK